MTIGENIKWLWRDMGARRLVVVINCMVGVAYVALATLFVWCSKLIIDSATGHNEYSVERLLYLFVAIVVAQIALAAVNSKLSQYNLVKMGNTLRRTLFERMMRGRWLGKERFHTGDVMNRIETDVTTVANMACVIIPNIVTSLAQVMLAFGLLHRFEPRLAWIVLVIMPIALLLSKRYFRVMRELTHRIRSKNSQLQSYSQEHIQHRTLHITIGDVDKSTSALATMQRELLGEEMNRTNYSIFSNSMVRIGFMSSYIVAFTWGVKGLHDQTISYGVMAAFMQLVAQIQTPTVNLSREISTVAQSLTSIDRLMQITDMEQEAEGCNIQLGEGVGVRFRNVIFAYDDAPDRAVLRGINHDFEPHKLHAIVGKSGAGKSTIIRMILALLTPQSGRATLYDQSSEHNCSPMTRSNITYVPQGNTLSSGTIRQNITLANSGATDYEIDQAIKVAAAEFIYELPGGLEWQCGENGAGLSEGQAQRIAIARGVLLQRPVVILDEPTAALDTQTESLMIERLREYAHHKTVIIVTHRPQTVAMCDTTLTLESQ
ncbi:MAG: ABC transporter ATP-binding protein [Rikenellaceae bacterium]